MFERKGLLAVLLLLVFGLSGCGIFNQRIVPESKVIEEAKKEAYRRGLAEGTELGRKLCYADFANMLRSDLENLKAFREYHELVRKGVLAPPKVVKFIKKPKIQNAGMAVVEPGIEYRIVRPARFVKTSVIDFVRQGSRYFIAGFFDTERSAKRYARWLKREVLLDMDKAEVFRTDDGDWAVVILSYSGKDYSEHGLESLMDPHLFPPEYTTKEEERIRELSREAERIIKEEEKRKSMFPEAVLSEGGATEKGRIDIDELVVP